MPVNRIPALLALLLAAVLTAAGPAHAGDRGAQSIFTLAEPAAVVETIGDHSVADEVDGSDPHDSNATGAAQSFIRAMAASGAAPAPSAASTRLSNAAHPYSARAPPAI